MKLLCSGDIEIQEPREWQVDVCYFIERYSLVYAPESFEILLGKRLRSRRTESSPLIAREFNVAREGPRTGRGINYRRIVLIQTMPASQDQLASHHRYSRSAYFDGFDVVRWSNDLDGRTARPVHPMALFSDEAWHLD
jgi:hypothetical protein